MLKLDFSEQTVLITGGTRGIGLETGLAFGRLGARCILTYRWGDHNETEICRLFEKNEAPAPLLIQADAAKVEDTISLMNQLKESKTSIDIFISNVSSALLIRSFEDYSLRALKKSISYSAWPFVEYTKQIHQAFGSYPRYVIGISSTGPDSYSYGYDFVAASKAVLEVCCRYLSYRLKESHTNLNIVRSRAIKTELFKDTFGAEFEEFAGKHVPDSYWIQPQEVAKVVVALCSGYCDGIQGQTLTVDRGTSFFDNFMDFYTRSKPLLESRP